MEHGGGGIRTGSISRNMVAGTRGMLVVNQVFLVRDQGVTTDQSLAAVVFVWGLGPIIL